MQKTNFVLQFSCYKIGFNINRNNILGGAYMPEIELLAPAGNFECMKAAVQNGADSVYFGVDKFNARIYASNLSLANMKAAISYCKLRNVKTHLTLNTLIKNSEFEDAANLAKEAYEAGIDAIIIQDLGLATY